MKPHGTIYRFGKGNTRGEKRIALPFAVRFTYHLLRNIGAGFVGFAVMGFLFTYGPALRTEFQYSLSKAEPQFVKNEAEIDTVKIAEAENVAAIQKEAESFDVNSYFSLVIPKIDAASNIVANVDPADTLEYMEALKTGVAHARGTYFPGQGKHIFLFAHSTDSPVNIARYNAVFYLLRKLEEGDMIIVFFSDKKYEYIVESKEVVDATDISWLTDEGNSEKLLLQTCYPPGTTWKRLIVIAVPAIEESELPQINTK